MKAWRLLRVAAALPTFACCAAHAVLPTAASPAAEPVRSFAAAGLLQAGFGLAVVIGLIFLFAWVARRFGLQPSGNGRVLKVVSSAMVGQRERVVVVEIGDTWLVLGVAAGQVSALHTLPAGEVPDAPAPTLAAFAGTGALSQKLAGTLARLTRRTPAGERSDAPVPALAAFTKKLVDSIARLSGRKPAEKLAEAPAPAALADTGAFSQKLVDSMARLTKTKAGQA